MEYAVLLLLLAMFVLLSAGWWWWMVILPIHRIRRGQPVALIGASLSLAGILIGGILHGEWFFVFIIGPWLALLAVPELILKVFEFPELTAVPLIIASSVLLLSFGLFRWRNATKRYAVLIATVLSVLALPVGVDIAVGTAMRADQARLGGTCLARLHFVQSVWLAGQDFRFSVHAVTVVNGDIYAWSYRQGRFFLADPHTRSYGQDLMPRCK